MKIEKFVIFGVINTTQQSGWVADETNLAGIGDDFYVSVCPHEGNSCIISFASRRVAVNLLNEINKRVQEEKPHADADFEIQTMWVEEPDPI